MQMIAFLCDSQTRLMRLTMIRNTILDLFSQKYANEKSEPISHDLLSNFMYKYH